MNTEQYYIFHNDQSEYDNKLLKSQYFVFQLLKRYLQFVETSQE